MISAIIPTYKNPESLELCIRSAVKGQKNNNQIIVIVDGFYDINSDVLDKWKNSIYIVHIKNNLGLCRATNIGVYNAQHNKILIVNDDNVFPQYWDTKLEQIWQPNAVISPNQIEPYDSIFSQFIINDLGRDPKTFDLEKFWNFDNYISTEKIDTCGSTLPIFMDKIDFIRLGGWDENYNMGMVADWDFFLKAKLSNLKMIRTWNCHFYHFVSLTTSTFEKINERKKSEAEGHEYARYKWGDYIKHNRVDNTKFL